MEPDLAPHRLRPHGAGSVAHGRVGGAVRPLGGTKRQAPAARWDVASLAKVVLRPEDEDRVPGPRLCETVELGPGVRRRGPVEPVAHERQGVQAAVRRHHLLADAGLAAGQPVHETRQLGERGQGVIDLRVGQ